jgi:hypothetical protein
MAKADKILAQFGATLCRYGDWRSEPPFAKPMDGRPDWAVELQEKILVRFRIGLG